MSALPYFAVIGHPISHSRSPEIHAAFASQCGIELSYERIDVEPSGLDQMVSAFFGGGGSGLNVTVPHKAAAFDLCTQHAARAVEAGVVNTLSGGKHGIVGDNTDGVGLLHDLSRIASHHDVSLSGQQVLVLGAGGAARGVLAGLCHEDLAGITVAARNPVAARQLAAHFAAYQRIDLLAAAGHKLFTFDIVINATSAGISAAVPEFDDAWLEHAWLAYDLSYSNSGLADTPFLMHAALLGVGQVSDGLGMLVEQAAESFLVWHRIRPDTSAVLAAMRAVP